MIIYNNVGNKVLEIEVDDNSYRNRAVMGDHSLTLYYSLPEHVEIPVGSYCEFQGETFTLKRPENFKMKHKRLFEYTVLFDPPEANAKVWKFRNPVDGRLKFSLTAKPHEHLQMFVDNMNRRDKGWTVGECIDGVETLIAYDHDFCIDALTRMASTFKTEYEFTGKRVSLRKIEYNKSNPLPLSYGRGNGFKPGVGRSNTGDNPPTEILFVQGGTDNIDPSKYGSSELLLPKNQTLAYDGEHFEDEDGFIAKNARRYVVDEAGLSIRRDDKQLSSLAEDSLDCSEIYPKRVGTVSTVVAVDEKNNFYDIVDTSIPSSLNYEECLIAGETMTVVFQTGMLAGREFEVKYYHNAVKGKAARRFEIVPADIDGQTMPNTTFAPKSGDKYAVFKCMLPTAYICDNATKTGASWDMFRAAVKHLFDNEDLKFTFTGELDGIWSKKDWVNIGGRIKLGGYIRFSDDQFQKDGVLVRITGIKDYINKPHSPVIELSNTTVSGSVSSTLNDLKSEEVIVDDLHRDAIQFTKRRFRDAKETISMLEEALLDNFTNSINPIAVQTMSMLVGDESLQFRFVNSKTSPVPVTHRIVYDNETKQLTAEAGIIQHMTLGINTVSASHKVSEYKFWDMTAYTSAVLDDGKKKYYLYAKVSKTAQTGVFILSENAIKLEGVSGFYHLLVGVLNSEYNEERSFVTLYGFTEILPGRITTDKIVSTDGNTYFDLLKGIISGQIKFKSGSSGLYELDEWEAVNGLITQAQNTANAANAAVESAKNAIAKDLGYANFDDLAKKAAANETIIVGGKINTTLINAELIVTAALLAKLVKVTELVAEHLTVTGSSKIAGFSVSGNGLTNTPFNNDAYVIFRNDAHKCFAGIGGNVLPTSSGLRAVARFENEDTSDWWGLNRNIATLFSAKNGRYNHAFLGSGNGNLDGWIGGYRYSKYNLTRANTIYSGYSNLKDNNRWVIYSSVDNSGITLPKLSEVRDALSIGSSTKFCVEFTIIADLDSKGFDIYGRNSKKSSDNTYPWNTSEYPNLVHWDNDHWDSLAMGAGDSLTVLLIYDSSKGGSKGGYPLTYTARVINRQN
nr:MAG: Prophage endopeptidase tail [Bacteriophage sp.]